MNKANNPMKAVVSIAVPLATGFVSGLFTITGMGSWYAGINKPLWNPPNWIFGPVWTLLYILMGIALYLIWKSNYGLALKKKAIWFWAIQMFLNFLWSFLFFNQHNIGLALTDIILLWIFILITILAFAKINKVAAWLMVPYISWVSFAGLLNYAIFNLN